MRSFAPPTTAARSHVEMTPRGVRAPVVTFIALLVMCVAFMVAMSPAVANAAPTLAELYPDDYPAELRDAPLDSIISDEFGPNRVCNSYVAWRLHRDGIQFTNVQVLWDVFRADDAGPAMAALGGRADNAPEVGAIIQWKRNEYIYSPDSISDSKRWGIAGSADSDSIGHVAYIEAINPDGSIVVSDYNLGEPAGMWNIQNVYDWGARILHFPKGLLGPPPAQAPASPPETEAPPALDEPTAPPPTKEPPTSTRERVCKRVALPRVGKRGRFALSDAQISANQRIARAAIARATKMYRDANRKVPAAAKKTKQSRPGKVALTRSQMVINHRIANHALKMAYRAEKTMKLSGIRAPDYADPPVGKPNLHDLRENQRVSMDALRRVKSVRCGRVRVAH